MRTDKFAKASLILGFLGVSVAITTGYLNPATGYELSIYTGTPVTFWVLCSLALLVSTLAVFSQTSRDVRVLGMFLGGLTMTTVVSLPLIRGYEYVGEHDPLSHLGITKDTNAGVMTLTENRYPVVHTLGSVLHDVTGLEIRVVLMILIVLFVVCFIIFIPIVIREMTGDAWMTYIGLFSGLLLLPINHLGSHQYIFPTGQAVLYSPVLLFAFISLYRKPIARYSAMFLLVATAFVLLHLQQAANFVLFFGTIAALQMGYDLFRGRRFKWRRKWVLPEVTFFTAVFGLWAQNFQIFWKLVRRVYMIPFVETQAAKSTVTRSSSLAEAGGSLPEIFAKMFLVSSVYVLLTGILMILVLRYLLRQEVRIGDEIVTPDGGSEQMLLFYVFAGLVAVTTMFLVFLVGGISDQYFRHLALLMVFGTILGAITIGRVMRYVASRWSSPTARRSIGLVVVLCLGLSLAVVFPSPYIYYSYHHVTEAQMDGYETTFEHQNDSVVFHDLRSDTYRYGHAIEGTGPPEAYYEEGTNVRGGEQNVPDHFAHHRLRSFYEEERYVPVPKADRVRDPILWKGFRFNHDDFAYLDSEPGIDRVQTNGGYGLYLVNPQPTQYGPVIDNDLSPIDSRADRLRRQP